VMFPDLETFVAVHRPCGELTGEVGEPEAEGYALRVACVCGVAFEGWVTRAMANLDLLRSRRSAHRRIF
jgi:hypothetical protein